MLVYIKSCNDSKKWYSNLVGQAVELLGEEESEYMSREPEGYINFISKEDGVVIAGD